MRTLKGALLRVAYLLLASRRRLWQPVTLGVRVLLVREGQVLLVRHTYREGWFFPGGGLKRHETLEAAARREAREEAGAVCDLLRLVGAYSNFAEARSDHVVLFICDSFHLVPNESAEIADARFFPMTALPPDVSASTHRRIQEYLASGPPRPGWW
ncbi:MAG: NUDIX domain-containing protein [Tepidiformaceae bacterium]